MAREETHRSLFGGCMSVEIPDAFIDVSTVRQVPDNQEVFVDVESNHSIVIELLEMTVTTPDTDPAQHHFHQLSMDNEAESFSRIHLTEKMPAVDASTAERISPEAQVWTAVGTQLIGKFHEFKLRDIVNIYMAVIRLPQCATDILITYNQPMATCDEEGVFENVLNDMSEILNQTLSEPDKFPSAAEQSYEQAIQAVYHTWRHLLSTFRVVDTSIFAE